MKKRIYLDRNTVRPPLDLGDSPQMMKFGQVRCKMPCQNAFASTITRCIFLSDISSTVSSFPVGLAWGLFGKDHRIGFTATGLAALPATVMAVPERELTVGGKKSLRFAC